jgi:hypothetical protein
MIALIFAFALLGHDALMATDAHAVEVTSSHHVEHTRTGAHVVANHHVDAGATEPAPEPSHDQSGPCEVARALDRPEAPNTEPSTLAAASGPVEAFTSLIALSNRPWWAEPTAPPGTRRAFFQVYRI